MAGALEAHRALLRNDATRLLRGSGEDPDDVLQDVHERVLVAARAGATGWETLPYLRRAVRNRCLDVLRARAARPATESWPRIRPPAGTRPAWRRTASVAELVADISRAAGAPARGAARNVLAAPAGGPADGASKMLLLRARRNLRVVAVARATPCHEIRAALAASAERGVRASELARRHVLSCPGCQAHRASGASRGCSHRCWPGSRRSARRLVR